MNIALIGLGMVAGTHVAAIRDSKMPLNLHGVTGRDAAKTREFAKLNDTKAYENIDELVTDEAVNFVIVATPPNARKEISDKLVSAQIPVLMEKPVERTLGSAQEIVQVFETAGIPLGVVFQHRMREASKALKAAVDNGQLGDICTIDVRVPWWRDQSYYDEPGRGTYDRDGGGVMISQAIHTLDLAMWIAGPIKTIQASMRQTPLHTLEAEDWASALFETDSGALGTLVATTSAFPGAAESITLQGTKAAAHLESGTLVINQLDGKSEIFGKTGGTGGGADPMAFTHAWHQSVIEDFAKGLKTGQPPMCTGREALRAHAVIDAMQKSSASGLKTEVSGCP